MALYCRAAQSETVSACPGETGAPGKGKRQGKRKPKPAGEPRAAAQAGSAQAAAAPGLAKKPTTDAHGAARPASHLFVFSVCTVACCRVLCWRVALSAVTWHATAKSRGLP